jgi:hypothetical protein
MKITRNDPCPCGSGIKYKKCCLDRLSSGSPRTVPTSVTKLSRHDGMFAAVVQGNSVDSSSVSVWRVLSETPQNGRRTAYDQFLRSRRAELIKLDGDRFEMADHLLIFVDWIEQQLAEVLRTHSSLFWLCVTRTIPQFNPQWDAIQRSRAWLPQARLVSLIMKHADNSLRDLTVNRDGLINFELKRQDSEAFPTRILSLFDDLANGPTLYNRVSRGAKLGIAPNGDVKPLAEPEAEKASMLYEERGSAFDVVLSAKGVSLQSWHLEGHFDPDEDYWSVLYYAVNAGGSFYLPELCANADLSMQTPNFVPATMYLQGWQTLLSSFGQAAEESLGMPLAAFVSCWHALNNIIQGLSYASTLYNALTKGLLVMPARSFSDLLRAQLSIEALELQTQANLNLGELVAAFMKVLLYDHGRLAAYDLRDGGVTGCAFFVGDSLVLDLTRLPNVIYQYVNDIQVSDQVGAIKGEHFESEVAAKVMMMCEEVSFPIEPCLELFAVGGRSPIAEADLYVQRGCVLFLVDCKARCVTKNYTRGNPRAAQQRWHDVKQWIKESDDRAQLIARTPIGANYQIPIGITHVVPIVCSSRAEYIWNLGPQYMLTGKIPRVCTLGELIAYLNNCDAREVIKKPFSFPIEGRSSRQHVFTLEDFASG